MPHVAELLVQFTFIETHFYSGGLRPEVLLLLLLALLAPRAGTSIELS